MPVALFDNLDNGNEDDVAVRHNGEALRALKLVHRVLRDTSRRDASASLFGKRHGLPLVIAPTGVTSWISYRGEVALARAAATANIPFVLTSTTNTPMETVRKEGGGTQWYQPVVWQDTRATLEEIDRARRAGFDGLVLSVDTTIGFNQPRDKRRGLTFPMKFRPSHLIEAVHHPRWTFGTACRYLLTERRLPGFANVTVPSALTPAERKRFLVRDDSLTWDFLRRVRDSWPHALIVKGLLHPDDALSAADAGADAVVVSNHGGRTIDAAPAPIELLPEVVAAVGGRVPVLVDGGFTRGSDVLKAVALGADAVMIGRATLYGLAAGGELGAQRALTILREEVERTMGALGLTRLSELGRDVLLTPGDLASLLVAAR
nr:MULTISPECIES: alpha-hydroxy acid oxidase [unclassified Cryobacterium]